MAGNVTEESGVGRSLEGVSSGQQQQQLQQYQAGEALAEWRSSEQVENGITSASPPYWDSDDVDDNGLKPAELYGKYTWKIDKFSQINKRELRSNAFEVGGYKWYILIYPQGCDVCNHLSLFLCVANHDKLLPGWSHFAQFTIAVVNKDPKKSKYSDTLHRFWKKEHDWGWKKFMELSKVLDGFIDADTLIIKAQVQVIRERPDRPFRCLDCQYRRELVRVYLTNVEQICRRFVEERRGKLGKLIEDKARWSSFCAFWLGMDQSARRRMTREKTDAILKVVVKNFFIDKEVTSTLVMDSLYSGLKALEGQTKAKKGKSKYLDVEELPVPIVRMEKDMFVLVDDVLLLLERVAMEPLPPKDEKGMQIRTKDGSSGEDFNKDSIERDERRLTELGRRTIEIFVLAHIFSSKIEVSYQEAVALKRQEELIREEEASWLAGSDQKAKRGAAEKEKKSKKKQGKQKKNNRKVKDKGKDELTNLMMQDTAEQETEESEALTANPDAAEDISDISDSMDCAPEVLQPDLEERDTSPVNWDRDTSEVHSSTYTSNVSSLSTVKNGIGGKSSVVMDDSSSTCSTDSVPSVATNGSHKGDQINKKSPSRGQNQRGKSIRGTASWANGTRGEAFEVVSDVLKLNDASGSCKIVESKYQASVLSLNNHVKSHEQHVTKEVVSQSRKFSARNEADSTRPSTERSVPPSPKSVPPSPKSVPPSPKSVPPSPRSPSKDLQPVTRSKLEFKNSTAAEPIPARKPTSGITKQTAESAPLISSAETKVVTNRITTPKPLEKPSVQQVPVITEKPLSQQVPITTEKSSSQQVPITTEKPSSQQVPSMSRPLSAPLVPGPRPAAPVVSMVQTAPLLSRSASAAGRLGPEPSATHSHIPQSYRNVMMGNPVAASSTGFSQPHSQSSVGNSPHLYSQSATAVSAPSFLSQSSERMESNSFNPSFSFGMPHHDFSQNGPQQWIDSLPRDSSRNMSSARSEIRNMEMHNPARSRSQENITSDIQTGTSGRQCVMADEFPHLDIINDLLDDEHGIEQATTGNLNFRSFNNGSQHLNRQFSFPGEMGIPNDVGPSTSSCRFERTRSHREDGFQRGYGFSGAPFDTMRDMIPQSQPYANNQIDMVPNWQMVGSDLSYLSLRSSENDGYAYQMPDYPNLACGVNGYSVFRPSNGH